MSKFNTHNGEDNELDIEEEKIQIDDIRPNNLTGSGIGFGNMKASMTMNRRSTE
jgi:hypothetical protein